MSFDHYCAIASTANDFYLNNSLNNAMNSLILLKLMLYRKKTFIILYVTIFVMVSPQIISSLMPVGRAPGWVSALQATHDVPT